MRVFVTGATGFIGSAIVADLLSRGDRVLCLARSDASAASLAAAGAQVHRGALDDLESLRRGAASADGVIHTAFIHDFSRFKENCEIDRRAIEALGSALVGSDRPLIVTSGTGLLAPGRVGTEADAHASGPEAVPRVASEEAAASVGARGVHVSVMRLPPTVHGAGDHGFVPALIEIARDKGVSAFIGDGVNRWPAVHRIDAAQAFTLALYRRKRDARYHAVAEEGVALKEIAATIGRHLNLRVASVPPGSAVDHFGWLAHFAALDCPASSSQTRDVLGWQPRQPTLLADLDQAYFSVR